MVGELSLQLTKSVFSKSKPSDYAPAKRIKSDSEAESSLVSESFRSAKIYSRSVDKGMGFEKLTIDIEHAVMNRCKDLIGVEARSKSVWKWKDG